MYADANISIFAGSSGKLMANRICNYMGRPLLKSETLVFSEGNTFVRFRDSVRDHHVYLIQPIGLKPNDDFVEILFWVDAFKRSSAHSVTVVMPYFGYAKGDKKDEPHVSIRARVCAECIELAGADRLMVMDLHAPQVQGFFKRPMDHLYALPLLCETALKLNLVTANTVVVSPDAGFAKQARKFGAYLRLPVAIGDKTRYAHDEKAQVLEIIGDVQGKDAMIVDDFSISCGTLCDLAKALRAKGARRIFAVLSHNVITETGAQALRESPIELIIATDTVDNPYTRNHERVHIVSAAPLFAETIIRYHNYQSVSPLFDSVPDGMLAKSMELATLPLPEDD